MKEGFYEWLRDVCGLSPRYRKWMYGTIYAMHRLNYPESEILYGDINDVTAKYANYKVYGRGMDVKIRAALANYRKFCEVDPCDNEPDIALGISPDVFLDYTTKYGMAKERGLYYYRYCKILMRTLKDEDYFVNRSADEIIKRYIGEKYIHPTNMTIGLYRKSILIYQACNGKTDYLEIANGFYKHLISSISTKRAEYYSNILIRFLSSGVSEEELITLSAAELVDKHLGCLTTLKTEGTVSAYREGIYHYQKYKTGGKVPTPPEYRGHVGQRISYEPPNKVKIDGYEDFYKWCIEHRRYSAEITRHYVSVIRSMLDYYGGDESKIFTGDTRDAVDKYVAESGRKVSIHTKNRGYRVALRSYREYKGVQV